MVGDWVTSIRLAYIAVKDEALAEEEQSELDSKKRSEVHLLNLGKHQVVVSSLVENRSLR